MSLQTPKPNTTPLVPGALDGRLALPDLWGIVRARKLDPPPAAVEKRLAVTRRLRPVPRMPPSDALAQQSPRDGAGDLKCAAPPAKRAVRAMMLCKPCASRGREPTLALDEQFSWLRLRADQASISDSASGGPEGWRPIRVLFDHTSGELLCGISNSHRFSVH